jgi:hypothetical protein
MANMKISNDRYIGFLNWVKKQLLPELSEPANQLGVKISLDLMELMQEIKKNNTSIDEVTKELKARRTNHRLPRQQRMIL